MTTTHRPLALVADIGGTNTRVALASGTTLLPESVQRFRNAGYPDLGSVLQAYMAEHNQPDVTAACVAAAGPVQNSVARLTNLDWQIDRPTVVAATGAGTVAILNDLQAQGHALRHLPDNAFKPVVRGTATSHSETRLVIGVGTGFNSALVCHFESGTLVPPSESGHTDLPRLAGEEAGLAAHLETALGHASVEDILSGRGLERCYAWLAEKEADATSLQASEILAAMSAEKSGPAGRAVGLFARVFGRVAGNLALVQLPTGGIYLSGGVARALTPWLRELGFAQAFREKGRFSDFMDQFSVSTIDDDFAALIGSASHLADLTATRSTH